MPAYIQGNLAVEQRTENKVKVKETKKIVYRNKTLPVQEKLLYLFTVAVCVVVAGVIIWRYAQIYEMSSKIQDIEKNIAKLEAENSILKQKVDALSDHQRLEEEARSRGYSVAEPNQTKPQGSTKSSGQSVASKTPPAGGAPSKKTKDQP
ncbi:cell division protein FtsL [Paenibacillus ehimensis]|uniref:Cell division protein FtsL n=1 Tax=Paenibacillus ehimensis TaxID=79264 RepID=A0ABT8VB29_9BACL|nr:cell division protein FtsL [Paenibacillus ehimensis]MDO3678151.1 cell division protein FtsL [Paenibacillus ehimensis]MEC0210613.1 cell division protein FtsL [Paenibacillus ehimensis]